MARSGTKPTSSGARPSVALAVMRRRGPSSPRSDPPSTATATTASTPTSSNMDIGQICLPVGTSVPQQQQQPQQQPQPSPMLRAETQPSGNPPSASAGSSTTLAQQLPLAGTSYLDALSSQRAKAVAAAATLGSDGGTSDSSSILRTHQSQSTVEPTESRRRAWEKLLMSRPAVQDATRMATWIEQVLEVSDFDDAFPKQDGSDGDES